MKSDDPKCAGAPKMTLKHEPVSPTAEKSLRDKLVNDINYQMICFDPKEECLTSSTQEAYAKLKNWDSSKCEKIKDTTLQNKIKNMKKVLADYTTRSQNPPVRTSTPGTTPSAPAPHTSH